MKTFVAPTASQLHLIHASSPLCSASLCIENLTSFFWRIITTDHEIPLPFIILSLCTILSDIELAIPEVSVLTPLLSSFTSPCVLALLFPFSAYSLALLCMETLLIPSDIHFSDTILWGAWRTVFLSKIIHLLHIWVKWTQVLVAAIWSYMVIDFTLQNFCHSKGVTLKLWWSLCWNLYASKSQNLYYWFFWTFPTIAGKCTFP